MNKAKTESNGKIVDLEGTQKSVIPGYSLR